MSWAEWVGITAASGVGVWGVVEARRARREASRALRYTEATGWSPDFRLVDPNKPPVVLELTPTGTRVVTDVRLDLAVDPTGLLGGVRKWQRADPGVPLEVELNTDAWTLQTRFTTPALSVATVTWTDPLGEVQTQELRLPGPLTSNH